MPFTSRDRISCLLSQRPVILVNCRVVLCKNINNASLSSSLVETYSNPVIISDTSSRPPQQVENPPYSLQLSSCYSWTRLRNITLGSCISKKFCSCVGRKSKQQLAEITGLHLFSSYNIYDLNSVEIHIYKKVRRQAPHMLSNFNVACSHHFVPTIFF